MQFLLKLFSIYFHLKKLENENQVSFIGFFFQALNPIHQHIEILIQIF